MSQMPFDLRFALRGLKKRASTSVLLVSTLAVGLAADAVIFNVLDVLVLRPFDFPNLPRLVRVHETSPSFDGVDLSNVAPANLLDLRAQAGEVFSDLVALEWWDANVRGDGHAERVQGYRVSPGFFEALGVRPVFGRGFAAEEGTAGRERVLVLGHDLWQRCFDGSPDVVGRTVTVDGTPAVVVGIAPRGFRFPDGAETCAPLVAPAAGEARRDRHYQSVPRSARGDGTCCAIRSGRPCALPSAPGWPSRPGVASRPRCAAPWPSIPWSWPRCSPRSSPPGAPCASTRPGPSARTDGGGQVLFVAEMRQ